MGKALEIQHLVNKAVESFHKHKSKICPWQGNGYFASKRWRGILGSGMAFALAVDAEKVNLKASHRAMLYQTANWWCDKFSDEEAGWSWARYGICAGWNGYSMNLYEAQEDDRGGVGGICDSSYQEGYRIGRECAGLLGLPLPDDIEKAMTEEDYDRLIRPNNTLSRKKTTTRQGGIILDGKWEHYIPRSDRVVVPTN